MLQPRNRTASTALADDAVLVFLRAPERGKVKTRLARTIGPDAALALYKAFVLDTLSMLQAAGRQAVICFHPADAEGALAAWLPRPYRCWPQVGRDLGERMMNAFSRAFSEAARRVLLVGTDIPDLPASIIQEAFSALDRRPAILGPSSDGGYYLIGFRPGGFLPECFRGIPWGEASVFQRTRRRMQQAGVPCHILTEWRDIDDGEDLQDLIRRRDALRTSAPRTFQGLVSLGLLPGAGRASTPAGGDRCTEID